MFIDIIKKSSLGLAISLMLLGCGGGGGEDNDFVGAGIVSITASPSSIDTADRTQIVIKMSEVSDTGIALKIGFPTALEYVPSTATLTANNQTLTITPLFNESEDEEQQFLVFFISAAAFGQKAEGDVRLQLVGRTVLKNGDIGVDLDIDDPAIDNIDEFDPSSPEYSPESEASIEVKA